MKLDLYLTPYTKNNTEWITDLNVRPELIKLLQENTEENLYDTGLVNDFISMMPKA